MKEQLKKKKEKTNIESGCAGVGGAINHNLNLILVTRLRIN